MSLNNSPLPPYAAIFLASDQMESLHGMVTAEVLLREMIDLAHSHDHARAIYAFNVATCVPELLDAVARFYGFEGVTEAKLALTRPLDRA